MQIVATDEKVEKYFFDISGITLYLSRESFFSGIQRTSVMIIEKVACSIKDAEVFITFFDPSKNEYCAIPYSAIGVGTLIDAPLLRSYLNIKLKSKNNIFPPLRKYSAKPIKLWFHALKFKINLLLGNESYFIKRNTTILEWRKAHPKWYHNANKIKAVKFYDIARADDNLVLLDATWTLLPVMEQFRLARMRGLNVYSMIHDLIPIVAPEYSSGTLPIAYHDWLIETSKFTSTYIANSRSTAQDLKIFLNSYTIDRPIQIVPLAQEGLSKSSFTEQSALSGKRIRADIYQKLYLSFFLDDELRSLLRHPYVLCVGTMEVRKNIWKIAQVWERLRMIPNIQLPKLIFAGRAGWLTRDFDNYMRATGNLYGWVEIFENPSDDEIAYLYRNCLFTITASCYEGWGLPIGESLSYGKTAVVSNVSSMPEVGGDLVEYCDPMSIDSILAACRKLIVDPGYREDLERRIKVAQLRSWEDVAAELVSTVRKRTSE